jgi:hypothetical protein
VEFTEITGEASRAYIFPSGEVAVLRVVRICIRPSGTHRLETESGEKYVIPTGWLALRIDAKSWSL